MNNNDFAVLKQWLEGRYTFRTKAPYRLAINATKVVGS